MPAPAPMTPPPAAMPAARYVNPVSTLPLACSSANISMSCSSLFTLSSSSLISVTSMYLAGEHGLLYVDLREYGENILLDHGDKNLERVQYHSGGHGDYGRVSAESQYEAEEHEDEQVSRQHVGVEPEPQGERLGELLEDFE